LRARSTFGNPNLKEKFPRKLFQKEVLEKGRDSPPAKYAVPKSCFEIKPMK